MGNQNMDHTVMFKIKNEAEISTRELLQHVYKALEEKGYSPVNQIVGYLLSGDPAYITSHQNARNMIRRLDRDELLEELVTEYLKVK
ncbi:MAG: IreB family regulatory phosphoprotein [Clostridiales bacterium]